MKKLGNSSTPNPVRYYNLVISDPTSEQVWKPTATGTLVKSSGGSTFTSFVNGKTDPGALNIEFDVPVIPFATPQGKAFIRVWGVGLQMLSQSTNLNEQNFVLSAGMQKGLPLANPKQANVIVQGQIFQAFGNWQGVNQSLDLVCYPGASDPTDQDISFKWPSGSKLGPSLTTTLQQAFPTYTPVINISDDLILPNPEAGHYFSLAQFADTVNQISRKIGKGFTKKGKNYIGVQLALKGSQIFAYDATVSTSSSTPKQLEFQDFIGQPTWIDPLTVNFKTVLRADINMGDEIKFPEVIVTPYALTSPNAAIPGAPARSKTAFQGSFIVTEVHHWANFRQPDADAWCTSFNAVTLQQDSST